MGNNPSSNQQNNNNTHYPRPSNNPPTSAPPTPTGTHHHHPASSIGPSPLNPHHQANPTTTFVDGGYLFPLSNIYPSSTQDWLQPVVQQLILDRRLAPFYRGLEDWEDDWDRQMIAHALQSITLARSTAIKQIQKIDRQESLEQPAASSKQHSSGSISKRFTKSLLIDHQSSSSLLQHQSDQHSNPRQQIFDAILNSHIRPTEIDQYLAQTVECPICFLYYPPNINLSRCCQQPICTECFTQIKRTDPTPQEIKSEPACCPYCVESNFGVTYEPPPPHKRTDWNSPGTAATTSDSLAVPVPTPGVESPSTTTTTVASQSAPSPSGLMIGGNLQDEPGEMGTNGPAAGAGSMGSTKMKRRQTTSHTSTEVVTTDAIQPDWQAKLEAVKAAVQRRANRRIIFRQEGDRLIPVGITSSRDPNGSAFLAAFEHDHSSSPSSTMTRRGLSALIGGSSSAHSPATLGGGSPGHHPGTRRHRPEPSSASNYGVDLEELMIMEAMRLSLAEEEERKRKAAAAEAFSSAPDASPADVQPSTSGAGVPSPTPAPTTRGSQRVAPEPPLLHGSPSTSPA
ncbi:hypothetical protein PTTG_01932, partial [Puccinia triticina 1-1 BBBD Race 1]